MKKAFFVALVFVLGFSSLSFAQDYIENSTDDAKEAEISSRVKKRLYPGGRDEEDLRVQNQLANPVRKLAPQAEIKDDSSEE